MGSLQHISNVSITGLQSLIQKSGEEYALEIRFLFQSKKKLEF